MPSPDADRKPPPPITAWFLGPKAEHRGTWNELLGDIVRDYQHWRRNYFPTDPSVIGPADRRAHTEWVDEVGSELDWLLSELKRDYPFFHPRYLAHMLSDQTLPAMVGYLASMLYNPNNVTEESAPVTLDLEFEVGDMIAEMLGYEAAVSWAHITSGGTVANIEALWVARQVQFAPLALRELCANAGLDFEVETPAGGRMLRRRRYRGLVDVPPRVAIGMREKLARYVAERPDQREKLWRHARRTDDTKGMLAAARESRNQAGARQSAQGDRPEKQNPYLPLVRKLIDERLASSAWNPARVGYHRLVKQLKRQARIFAPASAHYSIRKACDVLGYGQDALTLVPVDGDLRMSHAALRSMLRRVNQKTHYVAAVIGVVGSTEFGSVDSIDRLVELREELWTTPKTSFSFWIHADAAYGGYLASLFPSRDRDADDERRDAAGSTSTRPEVRVRTEATLRVGKATRRESLAWGDRDGDPVCKAITALGKVDSVTIDPHKLGYIPYPAGVIAFRDQEVTNLVAHKANYISGLEPGGAPAKPKRHEINWLGAHILEGSKPGAAAAGCWLAHKTIPLDAYGHGQIMRATLLSARRLARYLTWHRELYFEFERELGRPRSRARPFTFELLGPSEPDTNVVCFVVRPMERGPNRTLVQPRATRLEDIDKLTRCVYDHLGKPIQNPATPHSHPFFVSRTVLEPGEYDWGVLKVYLEDVDGDRYPVEGLTALRSAVISPYCEAAMDQPRGTDYMREFVLRLHEQTRECMRGLRRSRNARKR